MNLSALLWDLLSGLHLLSGLGLGAFALHDGLLAWAARRYRPPQGAPPRSWPLVTVQIPLYNERHVVDRLLEAVRRLEYPRDRLEVQLLDDSQDETRERAAAWAERLRAEGIEALHLRRPRRDGFKAGALAAGLARARGRYVALFDADFLPPARILKAGVALLEADPRLACVQFPWGHLNAHGTFTRAQALGLDGQFYRGHPGRLALGGPWAFNGSAALWRTEAIRDAGGWSDRTLVEDLDLSFRAALRGWRMAFLPAPAVPGELPEDLPALRRQQRRWAAGTGQAARKLLGPLWRSSLPLRNKLLGTARLLAYAAHGLLLLWLLTALAGLLHPLPSLEAFLLPLSLAFLGPLAFYLGPALERGAGRRGLPTALLGLVAQVIGLSPTLVRAYLQGLLGRPLPFERTPKYGGHPHSRYRLPRTFPWAELLLGGYAAAMVLLALGQTRPWSAFWLGVYAYGFWQVALWELKAGRSG